MSRTMKIIIILSTLFTLLIIGVTALTTMVHTMDCEHQQHMDEVLDPTHTSNTTC